jgi:hypothetical protein
VGHYELHDPTSGGCAGFRIPSAVVSIEYERVSELSRLNYG